MSGTTRPRVGEHLGCVPAACRDLGITQSAGRTSSCLDNAVAESFFALLQKNVLNRQSWATRDELRFAIITWIETTYNRRRRQRVLGRLTPVEFEAIIGNTHLAAAAA